MAASDTLTWDIEAADGGARRPTIDDVGGAVLEDDVNFPPSLDGRMPYADMLNECQRQVVAMAAVVPSAILTIDYSGGTPSVVALQCPSRTLEIADFTLTDNGTGDVTIAWPSGSLPAMVCDPTGNVNAGTAAAKSWDGERVSATSVRVRVMSGSAAADVRFTVQIH